jgi:predicted N-acetyltransferase YhbS
VLQVLAVEPQWQGQGIGSALMAPELARCDLEQVPVYLEATSAQSAALHERHGFDVTGEPQLPGGPSRFPMWRGPA